MRYLSVIAVALAAVVLATGCGGSKDQPKAALGTPQNPMVATTAAATPTSPTPAARRRARAAAAKPNYEELPQQRAAPTGKAFSPCNLVSQSRAEAILRGAIQAPLEAPQGPTCIYRTKKGASFVTVAVQAVTLRKLHAQLAKADTSTVGGRTAYCAKVGNPTLYVPLGSARILTVSAPCKIAKAFARTAVVKLPS